MSLEAIIQENTSAIRELIAAIKSGVPVAASTIAAVVEQDKTATASADAKTTEKGAEEKKPAAETASSTPGATPKSADPKAGAQGTAGEKKADAQTSEGKKDDAPTYQDAAAAVTKLSRVKGRDAAVAVLAKFNAKKLPDIQPAQFAAVIAACETAETEAVEA